MENQQNMQCVTGQNNVSIHGVGNQEVEVAAQNDGSTGFVSTIQKEAITAIEEALMKEDDSDAQSLNNNQALIDIMNLFEALIMGQEEEQGTQAGLGPQEQNNAKGVVEKQNEDSAAAAPNINKP
ncbi:hypothetical protein JCGZ_13564 [Jatropha curcas]|uniref:Uncharacterized protein n=1 Tax=Jatropha curcas TaxID=180498 RepID=A0A067KAE1_JATCU|nr:hypothetical protein JCGZ_13564 [Jatropha curcas]